MVRSYTAVAKTVKFTQVLFWAKNSLLLQYFGASQREKNMVASRSSIENVVQN